jgi:hypothetical protein
MTPAAFSKLTYRKQMEYLMKTAILIHKIMKGDLIVSLYWSKDFIFEVLSPKSNLKRCEIKCYDRFKYIES